ERDVLGAIAGGGTWGCGQSASGIGAIADRRNGPVVQRPGRPLDVGKTGGSSPPGITASTEGLPDGRRVPVGSRLSTDTALRVRLPLLPLTDGGCGVAASARLAVNQKVRVRLPPATLIDDRLCRERPPWRSVVGG